MANDTPVVVQVDARAGAAVPHSFSVSGQRYRVVELARQWDRARQRYYEVRLGDGHTAILRLDRRADVWYLVDMHGKARLA